MLIIGIDPGISGAICFLKNGKIVDAIEMPSMAEGKKNKKQVNGSQIFNEISTKIKEFNIMISNGNKLSIWLFGFSILGTFSML